MFPASENRVQRIALKGTENMSTENTVSISIDPSPLVSIIKKVISEELQPTLYGNDNSLAQVVNEEILNSPDVHDRITTLINKIMDGAAFQQHIDKSIEDFFENGYSASRVIARAIDYGEVAGCIDASDLASEISYRELASEIDADEIANRIEIDMDTLAENIDYKKLAAALLEELAVRVKN